MTCSRPGETRSPPGAQVWELIPSSLRLQLGPWDTLRHEGSDQPTGRRGERVEEGGRAPSLEGLGPWGRALVPRPLPLPVCFPAAVKCLCGPTPFCRDAGPDNRPRDSAACWPSTQAWDTSSKANPSPRSCSPGSFHSHGPLVNTAPAQTRTAVRRPVWHVTSRHRRSPHSVIGLAC